MGTLPEAVTGRDARKILKLWESKKKTPIVVKEEQKVYRWRGRRLIKGLFHGNPELQLTVFQKQNRLIKWVDQGSFASPRYLIVLDYDFERSAAETGLADEELKTLRERERNAILGEHGIDV